MTTTCEQYLHPAAVAEAALASGIRCVLTPGIFDVPGAGPGASWQAHLAEACRVFDEMDGRGGPAARRVRSPCRLQRAPGGAVGGGRRGAAAATRSVQIHLAETEAEGRVVEERYGMGAPALLASLGVLDGRVLAAHAVWLDEAEMDLLAEHDVAVAHCPGSNGKLGAGVARLAELLARGVRVGLGTDGPASNDDLHLWDEMRLAAILARADGGRPGGDQLGGGPPPGHPGRGRGAGAPRRRARGGPAGRHHPPAHRRCPLHARRSTTPSCSGTWSGPVPATW